MSRASKLCVVALLGTVQACSSSSHDCGTQAETFVAYAPGAAISAIPLCTSGTETAPAVDGAVESVLPGSSALSAAAVAQCEAICTQSTTSLPCCVSMWEPSTVVCAPLCVP